VPASRFQPRRLRAYARRTRATCCARVPWLPTATFPLVSTYVTVVPAGSTGWFYRRYRAAFFIYRKRLDVVDNTSCLRGHYRNSDTSFACASRSRRVGFVQERAAALRLVQPPRSVYQFRSAWIPTWFGLPHRLQRSSSAAACLPTTWLQFWFCRGWILYNTYLVCRASASRLRRTLLPHTRCRTRTPAGPADEGHTMRILQAAPLHLLRVYASLCLPWRAAYHTAAPPRTASAYAARTFRTTHHHHLALCRCHCTSPRAVIPCRSGFHATPFIHSHPAYPIHILPPQPSCHTCHSRCATSSFTWRAFPFHMPGPMATWVMVPFLVGLPSGSGLLARFVCCLLHFLCWVACLHALPFHATCSSLPWHSFLSTCPFHHPATPTLPTAGSLQHVRRMPSPFPVCLALYCAFSQCIDVYTGFRITLHATCRSLQRV